MKPNAVIKNVKPNVLTSNMFLDFKKIRHLVKVYIGQCIYYLVNNIKGKALILI